MQIQLAMAETRGLVMSISAPTTVVTTTTTTARRNVVFLPSSSFNNSPSVLGDSTDDIKLAMVASSTSTAVGFNGEVLQPESCWLDLTSDFSNFMELADVPEVVTKERKDEVPVLPNPNAASPPAAKHGPYSQLLPHIIRDMGLLRESQDVNAKEEEVLMEANMKILDNFIMDHHTDSLDESLDSFGSDLEANESLFNEVETYLQLVSGGEPTSIVTLDDDDEDAKMGVEEFPCRDDDVLLRDCRSKKKNLKKIMINEEKEENSSILKAMVMGKVLATGGDGCQEDFTAGVESSREDISLDLTEEDLANAYTTTIKTETGQDVIIIIAQPSGVRSPASGRRPVPDAWSPRSDSLAASPAASYSSASSDYEWSPSPVSQRSVQPKKYQRKNRPILKPEPYPREKGERKKAQNRTAAFRYREKKKAEQDAVDMELELLADKNKALKARLRDMEQELRCVKRLMVETGLGHLV